MSDEKVPPWDSRIAVPAAAEPAMAVLPFVVKLQQERQSSFQAAAAVVVVGEEIEVGDSQPRQSPAEIEPTSFVC